METGFSIPDFQAYDSGNLSAHAVTRDQWTHFTERADRVTHIQIDIFLSDECVRLLQFLVVMFDRMICPHLEVLEIEVGSGVDAWDGGCRMVDCLKWSRRRRVGTIRKLMMNISGLNSLGTSISEIAQTTPRLQELSIVRTSMADDELPFLACSSAKLNRFAQHYSDSLSHMTLSFYVYGNGIIDFPGTGKPRFQAMRSKYDFRTPGSTTPCLFQLRNVPRHALSEPRPSHDQALAVRRADYGEGNHPGSRDRRLHRTRPFAI